MFSLNQFRLARRSAGLCRDCDNPAALGKARCDAHLAYYREKSVAYQTTAKGQKAKFYAHLRERTAAHAAALEEMR